MTNCQLTVTDNVTSAPSVGQSTITQKDESRVEQVGARQQEGLLRGEICLLPLPIKQNVGHQTAEEQNPTILFTLFWIKEEIGLIW